MNHQSMGRIQEFELGAYTSKLSAPAGGPTYCSLVCNAYIAITLISIKQLSKKENVSSSKQPISKAFPGKTGV